MSFRGPKLSISKFSIQIRISTPFQNWLQNPGSSKLSILPILPPGLWISKYFLKKTDLDSFQYGFQPLHLRFYPFVSYFNYHSFTKSLYRGQLFSKNSVLPISPDFVKIPKEVLLFGSYFNKEAMWDPHWDGVTQAFLLKNLNFEKPKNIGALPPGLAPLVISLSSHLSAKC